MKVTNNRAGKGTKRDTDFIRRIFMILLLAVLFFSLSSNVAEAAAKDSLKNMWGSMRVYMFSAPFWVNALLVFAGLFLLYSLLLSKHVGTDGSAKAIAYIVLALVAIIIATKIVASNGVPQYLWHENKFSGFVQFAIGPPASRQQPACGEDTHSLIKTLSPWGGANPPCCGTGAYMTNVKGKGECKQALLRTNENGSGLPAFILATILFYLLFSAFGGKLGTDRAGKWFPILLSVLLGAMMANSRVTKNNLVMIGGWVAVLLIGSRLSKSFAGEGEKTTMKKAFGMALAFAFVELIANMLGSSLTGGSVSAGEIGSGSIIYNLIWGMIIGYAYTLLTGEGGIMGEALRHAREQQKQDIRTHIDNGNYRRAMGRMIPLAGRHWFRPERQVRQDRTRLDALERHFNRLMEQMRIEMAPPENQRNHMRIAAIQRRMDELADIYNQEAIRTQAGANATLRQQPAQQQAQPQAQPQPQPTPARTPPPVPNVQP